MTQEPQKNSYLFVSNVDIRHPRGGWDGLGSKIFHLLSAHFGTVDLLEKVNPPIRFISKASSKLARIIGWKADFPAFSKSRLDQVASEIRSKISPDTDYLIFHGSTPWVNYTPTQPYCAILDCSFITYMRVYHNMEEFSKTTIQRVRDRERIFFENAQQVFFTSEWGIKETCRDYQLEGKNFTVIGQGPSVDIEIKQQELRVKKQFLFIGTDFLGKGGGEICTSFQKFLEDFPDYELVIVGQRPPDEYLQGRNIKFVGFINKSTPEGKHQLEQLYRESTALLLVTQKDIMPLVVIEAGMYGCPSIANDVSAVGEMIQDGETGFLIESNAKAMLDAMKTLAAMSDMDRARMRRQVQQFMNDRFSWDRIIGKMIQSLTSRKAKGEQPVVWERN